MTPFTEAMRPRLSRFMPPDVDIQVVFLASDFETAALDGGSTRIVAVTERDMIVVRGGLLRRSRPVALDRRIPLSELANPLFAWPGKTLYGEEYAEILPGLWVHRRYRDAVVAAFGVAVRAVA